VIESQCGRESREHASRATCNSRGFHPFPLFVFLDERTRSVEGKNNASQWPQKHPEVEEIQRLLIRTYDVLTIASKV
jgi:hypothetical protein